MALMLLLGLVAGYALPASAQPTYPSTNQTDRAFVAQAAAWHQQDLEAADAHRNSGDASVRYFAQTSIKEDRVALSHIQALAEQHNVPYPNTVQPPTSLSAQAYMKTQVAYHQKAVALYENEIRDGSNPQFRTYAAHVLPVLKKHLAMAQQYVSTGHIAAE